MGLEMQGIRIQRERVRSSIRRIDPWGMVNRFAEMTTRRVYSVAGPNSLWHIDGNHKLIRWKFVVHGGIDGYSRKVMYLHCSTNNWSDTVTLLFVQAVNKHGQSS